MSFDSSTEFIIPRSHPRYHSLVIREKLVRGFREGYVVPQGLIAHGRGEAFDYLIGECTIEPARRAMYAAVALMLLAERPIISVNGNVAALVAEDVVKLAEKVNAAIEINLFYRTSERVRKIAEIFRKLGVEVLGTDEDELCTIPELFSERRKVSCRGIYTADVVLVALEDGDRTEALRKMGKKVIAIDLNPLSRTARAANITIVDNVVRAIPEMVKIADELRGKPKHELENIVQSYNNEEVLRQVLEHICARLRELAEKGVTIKFD